MKIYGGVFEEVINIIDTEEDMHFSTICKLVIKPHTNDYLYNIVYEIYYKAANEFRFMFFAFA